MSRLSGFIVIAASVFCVSLQASQAPAPSARSGSIDALAGKWELEGFRGAGPFGLRVERAICGTLAKADADTPDGSGQVGFMGTVDGTLTIAVSKEAVSIERRFAGSAGSGTFTGRYALDGTETPNTTGDLSSKTKASVRDGRLTISGTVTAGAGAAAVQCAISETFEVDAERALVVTATGDIRGTRLSSTQRYVRK